MDKAVVKYWDFGITTRSVLPIWRLVRPDENGTVTAEGQTYTYVDDHPPIIDGLPGDDGYSPFWRVTLVVVTDAYQGEQLTSFEAIQSAIDLGLASATVRTETVVNCPVVLPEARLETSANPDPGEAPIEGYYRGGRIHYFSFGPAPTAGGFVIAPQFFFRVAREGTAIMDEAIRGIDVTGDTDLLDTNNVFAFGPTDTNPYGDPANTTYSPLVQWVNVDIDPMTQLIDNSGGTDMNGEEVGDERSSGIKSFGDLFTGDASADELTAKPEQVRAFQREEGIYHNSPIEVVPESTP